MTESDFLIVGGGVGGLTLGYRLARAGRRVSILEKNNRPGGVIQSEKIGGFLLERGPNSFSSSPEIMALLTEIGLADRALLRPMRDHERFVWKQNRLRRVPMGPAEFLRSDVLTFGEKLRIVKGLFSPYVPPKEDVPIGEFFRAVVGPAPVESLLKPFLAGVYAADADRVSLDATFPKLFDAIRQEDRLFRALKRMRQASPSPAKKEPRSLVSFPDGLIEFPTRLKEKFIEAGGQFLHEQPGQLRREGGCWLLPLQGDEQARAQILIVATPADAASELLLSVDHHASAALAEIPYAELRVVHVGLEEKQVEETRNGFGFLTVADQGVNALGMIWSDRIFPNRAPEGHRLLTCFYGGEKDPAANRWSDKELEATLRKDLKITMGFRGGAFPLLRITRWDRALPIFRVGHREHMAAALMALPEGIEVLSNYVGGVSMPDRVAAAEEMAGRLLTGQTL